VEKEREREEEGEREREEGVVSGHCSFKNASLFHAELKPQW
jgi:hypothetical protein